MHIGEVHLGMGKKGDETGMILRGGVVMNRPVPPSVGGGGQGEQQQAAQQTGQK